ncbi:MAG: DUF3078 domain-containing protein [Ignavibacteria bacterium]|nr:DUF3078 domain-containing protein [Ignavibacteria bacterium]
MKKFLFLILLSFVLNNPAQIFSQKKDSLYKPGWTPRGVVGFNLSQVALSNWSQGGENILSLSGLSNFGLDHYKKPWLFKNSLIATLGSTKSGGGSFQTNDNIVSFENVLIYKVGWAVDPFIANEIRTGILNGYDYKQDPAFQTASFFDPGYVTQSIGFTFDRPNFSSRIGLAFKETFTNKFRQYSDDVNTSDKKEAFKFQTGVESVTEANYNLAENLFYTSKLRLFSAFETLDVWDVGWDNTITAKVNDIIAVNLNVLLIYEKAQSPKTQLKEGLNLGISYTVF